MPDSNGNPVPRTRDFSEMVVVVRGSQYSQSFQFKDAHVTFWPDGWAEVYGRFVPQDGVLKGKAMPKGTYNFSNAQTVSIQGTERHDD